MRDAAKARIARVMRALLAERGTATACPSEIARRVDPGDWRALMPAVRAVAARLQRAGEVDGYQHGRPVAIDEARGPIRLRSREAAAIDYRVHPERYVVGRGEQGVLTVEPYKSELLPLWRFRTLELARASVAALRAAFERYRDAGDFVGMDMARKFLQMGWTRARRYANHRTGRKWDDRRRARRPLDPDRTKAEIAAVFRAAYEAVLHEPAYAGALAARKLVATRGKTSKEPREQPVPRRGERTELTAASKASARARVKRAGRSSSSLADNRNAAKRPPARRRRR